MKRTTNKSGSKSSSKKVNFTNNAKSNTIFEDISIFKYRGADFTNTIRVISDPKEPFFKETIRE
jgi:hypothetical protein